MEEIFGQRANMNPIVEFNHDTDIAEALDSTRDESSKSSSEEISIRATPRPRSSYSGTPTPHPDPFLKGKKNGRKR